MLRLFMITDTPEGQIDYDRSLLVAATSATEAERLWQEFYDVSTGEPIDHDENDHWPERIFEVTGVDPKVSEPTAFAFNSAGMPQVGGRL